MKITPNLNVATLLMACLLGAMQFMSSSTLAQTMPTEDDCVENGGKAQCTAPLWKEEYYEGNPVKQSDGNGFAYSMCHEIGPTLAEAPRWCAVQGGTWTPLPQGGGTCANAAPYTDAGTRPSADKYVRDYVQQRTCGFQNTSDTGWGATEPNQVCWGGPDNMINGQVVRSIRIMAYKGNTYQPATNSCGTSEWTTRIFALKVRTPECPPGYRARTRGSGNATIYECFIPPPCETCRGNPVDVGNGTKRQAEVIYKAPYEGGLDFSVYYNSAPYLTSVEVPSPSMYWRHTFDRRIHGYSGNAYIMAVARRHDGTVQYFDNGGKEVHNVRGGGNRLERILNAQNVFSGWRYTNANSDVETYNTEGYLTNLVTAKGYVYTLNYTPPAPEPMLTWVDDSFGRKLNLNYWGVDLGGQKNIFTTFGIEGVGSGAFVWNDSNKLQYKFLSTFGPTLREFHYEKENALHLLTGITDESGRRYATYDYDSSGRVLSSKHGANVDQIDLNYGSAPGAYAANTVVDSRGVSSTYSFARVGGALKQTSHSRSCPGGGCTSATESATYDANGNRTSSTDFRGTKTCYTHDATRNLETVRIEGLASSADCAAQLAATALAAPARKISTEWSSTHRIARRIAEPKRITMHVFFGDAGTTGCAPAGASTTLICEKRVQETTDESGMSGFGATTTGTARTWAWTYGDFGRILTAKDPLNNTTNYEYYTNTVEQNAILANSRGLLKKVTNAAGHSMTYSAYDVQGRATEIKDANDVATALSYHVGKHWLLSKTTYGEATIYSYNLNGTLQRVTMPDNSVINYAYDDAQRLTSISDGADINSGNRIVYTLDSAGNRIEEKAFDPTGNLTNKNKRDFDKLNRMEKMYHGAQDNATTPYQYSTVYGYDANGNQSSITDAANGVTSQFYDAFDRLMTSTKGGHETKYDYDRRDNLVKVTEPTTPASSGTGARRLETTYEYNGFGEMKRQVSPDTGATDFTYDAAGNLKTRIDARSICATYDYDALNRVSKIRYATTCNPAIADEEVSYTYDGPANCTNGKGRLCTITDKTGTTSYTYDALGRVTSKTQVVAGQTQTVGYRYNSAGQLDQITYPSGKKIGYSYANNRVTGVTLDSNAAVLSDAKYRPFGPVSEWKWGSASSTNKHVRSFDLDNRTLKVESGLNVEAYKYQYNNLSLIDKIERIDPAGNVIPSRTLSFGYNDPFGRLTALTPDLGSSTLPQSFGYDGVGNRRSQSIGAAAVTFGYGATSNWLTSLSGNTKSYDSVGNLTTQGTTRWNYAKDNRITTIEQLQNGNYSTYLTIGINALGQRVRKSVSGGLDLRFVYDETGKLIGEYTATGATIREHIWMNDAPVGVLQ